MEFISIDVETANASMASICQVGIASFCGGMVVDEWESLVDPEDFFDFMNTLVHGIGPDVVVGAPTIPTILEELRTRLNGQVVVCHTHFDRVAIGQASSGYGLSNVCRHIGYDYEAHDALEDAKAAGMVMVAAIRESGLSVHDWVQQVASPSYYRIARGGDPGGPLYGEAVVFTGALHVPRREAADLAARLGCRVLDGVSKKTTILVVGDQDVMKLAGHEKSSKHRKAEDLIDGGHSIRILKESDFLEIVASLTEETRS
jgi:DNA polymerase-3 subunit epsilon